MNILPLGSVVQLKNGDVKLMIISRVPLYEQNGKIGYFDYSACIFPTGQLEEKTYFFNRENIEKVYFKGYVDKQEELFQEKYEENIKSVKYPKLSISD